MHPLLVPSYVTLLLLWTTIMCYLPLSTRIMTLIGVFMMTTVVPSLCITLMSHLHIITDLRLINRHERALPYLVTILCYSATSWYFTDYHYPDWFCSTMWGATTVTIVVCFINHWWKISGHMTGMGALLAELTIVDQLRVEAFELYWVIIAGIIIAGMVGSARILLGRHTLMQVIVGFFNSFFIMIIITRLMVDY